MLKNIKYKASGKEITAASVLLGAVLLSEFHAFLRRIYPNVAKEKLDLFLSPHFKMIIQVQWYVKMILDPLVPMSVFFCLGYLSKEKYPKIFYISIIWLVYNFMDLVLFAWNYKADDLIYDFMMLIGILFTIFILLSKNKRLKKV